MVTPDGQEVSYGQVAAIVDSFTLHAALSGLGRGHRVLIQIDNYVAQFLMTLALSRLGVTCAFGFSLSDAQQAELPLDAMITVRYPAAIGSSIRFVPFNQGWLTPPENASTTCPGHAHENDAATIVSSSGTTGKKKMMAMSMEMIRDRLAHDVPIYGTGFHRKMFTLGARTHYGFMLMMMAFRQGAAILHGSVDMQKTLELMTHYQIEALDTSPGIISNLVQYQQERNISLPFLRQITVAGSTISPSLLRKASTQLCPSIQVNYGATECGVVAYGKADQLLTQPLGAVGNILPEYKIVVLDDNDQPLPIGETGKIGIQSPGFEIKDYLSAGSGTSSLKNGLFFPGDMGYVTEQEILVITGRFSDLINMGGNKLSPETIEAKLATIHGVLRTGVVGTRNANGFEDVCVTAVCEEGVGHDHLLGEIKRLLGSRIPLRLRLADSLPFNDGGKIDRELLRKTFSSTTTA
jgi:acyl-coenzyme A synthetase/AMP-(fatty) acid ligase